MQVKVFYFPSTFLLWKALSNEIHYFTSNNFLLSILCIYTFTLLCNHQKIYIWYLQLIIELDENISQYYFQIAKIDIVLQSSEFCMIFWDEFKRHLVRKCSIFPAAQSPKLWLKTLCYISRAKLLLKLALVFIIRSTFLTNHLYYRLLSLANEFINTVTLFQIQFDSKSLSILNLLRC